MLKKVMSTAMAIVAIAGAVAGSSNAKALLEDNEWLIVETEERATESEAQEACPGLGEVCAYEIDAQGMPTGNQFFKQ